MLKAVGTLLLALTCLWTPVTSQALATATLTFAPSDADGNPYGAPVVIFADGVHPNGLPGGAPWLFPIADDWAEGGAFAPSLAPGQVLDRYWAYTVELHVDGLLADRNRQACMAWFEAVQCAPPATGNELAVAAWGVASEHRHVGGADTSQITFADSLRLSTSGQSGQAETISQSGVLHLQVTGLASQVQVPNQHSYVFWVWVDSNPVGPIPEPSTYLLTVSGLMLMAVLKRRRLALSR